MPELPEVETTLKGLEPLITDRKILSVQIYKKKLRWEIPTHLKKTLKNQTISKISRRAKYLLLHFDFGQLVMHLGMSGSISVVNSFEPLRKHDHFELKLDNSKSLRFHDPRRFGSILWQSPNQTLALLENLGPEPLSYEFDEDSLFSSSIGKSRNIKSFIMDSKIVVGVGNIYACEILYDAKISPLRKGSSLEKYQIGTIIRSIRKILNKAIKYGGSSINDYVSPDGTLGNFQNKFNVYGQEGLKIKGYKIKKEVLYGRSTFFCPEIQK